MSSPIRLAAADRTSFRPHRNGSACRNGAVYTRFCLMHNPRPAGLSVSEFKVLSSSRPHLIHAGDRLEGLHGAEVDRIAAIKRNGNHLVAVDRNLEMNGAKSVLRGTPSKPLRNIRNAIQRRVRAEAHQQRL